MMERVNGFFEFDSELIDYELVILNREDNGDEVVYELEVSFNGFTFEMEYSLNDDYSYYCGFDDFQDSYYQGFNYVTLKNKKDLSDNEICLAWDMLDVATEVIKTDIVY